MKELCGSAWQIADDTGTEPMKGKCEYAGIIHNAKNSAGGDDT